MKSAVVAVAGSAVCRCYIHPAVLEAYLNGNSVNGFKPTTQEDFEKKGIDLASAQAAVLKFLQGASPKRDA
jgi:DNA topoisomerase IB